MNLLFQCFDMTLQVYLYKYQLDYLEYNLCNIFIDYYVCRQTIDNRHRYVFYYFIQL